MHAYNHSLHRVIGFMLHQLFSGRPGQLSLPVLIDAPEDDQKRTWSEWIKDNHTRMNSALDLFKVASDQTSVDPTLE